MKIEFIQEASIEYISLDGSLKVLVDKLLVKLEKNPFLINIQYLHFHVF